MKILNNLMDLTLVLVLVSGFQYVQASTTNDKNYDISSSLRKPSTNTINYSPSENVASLLSEIPSSTNDRKGSSAPVKDEQNTETKSNQKSTQYSTLQIHKSNLVDHSCMGQVNRCPNINNVKVITGQKVRDKHKNIPTGNKNVHSIKHFAKKSQINQNPDHK